MAQETIAVIGLGYVGLPLVRLFSGKGFTVVGFDVDRTKIEKLRKGKSYIKSFPSSAVATLVRNGRFTATDDFRRLRNVDAVIICVPTPLAADGQPDLSCD